MSGYPGGQLNDLHNVQKFSYIDGNQQMQYSNYSWRNSQQRTRSQTPILTLPQPRPQIQSSPMPPMLPGADVAQHHTNLHGAHFQSAMQHHQNVMESMQVSMNSMMPAFQFQQPALVPASQQARIQYAQSPLSQPAKLQYAPPAQIVAGPGYVEGGSESSNYDQEKGDAVFQRQMAQEDMRLQARVKALEDQHAHGRLEQEAKEQELQALRVQVQQLHHERAEIAQQHNRHIAEMAHIHASTAPPTNPLAFDMGTLQKLVEEVQRDRISHADVQHLVADTVRKEVAGVARTTDIESAASRMEKGLNKLSTGVTAAQVQETVQRELASAVQKVVRSMPAQQQRIEAPYQPTPMPWRTQAPAAQTPQAEGDLVPDDSANQASGFTCMQRSLPAPSMHPRSTTLLTAEALASLQPTAGPTLQKSRQSKTRTSVMSTTDNSLVRLPREGSKNARKSSKMSTLSVQPSASDPTEL